jgi:hypothetical protein
MSKIRLVSDHHYDACGYSQTDDSMQYPGISLAKVNEDLERVGDGDSDLVHSSSKLPDAPVRDPERGFGKTNPEKMI